MFRPDSAAADRRTGSTCRSATTAAPARWWSPAPPVVRPCGQRKAPDDDVPTFGPSRRLDIEAEVGFVVGTPSRARRRRCRCGAFAEHVFGVCLVNDWSARDIQAWEYVPLGPFLGKSFLTSVSPWVVPLAALEAARVPPPAAGPASRCPTCDDADAPVGARPRAWRCGSTARCVSRPPFARDVLDRRPAAGAPDRQRGVAAHRRPVRLRHGQRPGARPAGLAARAVLERHRAADAGRRLDAAPSSRTATSSRSPRPHRAPAAAGSAFGEVTGQVQPAR